MAEDQPIRGGSGRRRSVFEKYEAEADRVDPDRWREIFSAKVLAVVETEAEAAAEAAYAAVRRAAELADAIGGAQSTAELAREQFERLAAEIVQTPPRYRGEGS